MGAATRARTAKKGLTPKQAKFVKGVVEGKTLVKAAMDAYPSRDYKSASVQAAQNLEKLSIKQALADAYYDQGITAERIAAKLSKHMDAKKVEVVEYTGPDGVLRRKRTKVDDAGTQLNAIRTAAQLIGLGRNDNDGGGNTTLNFNFGTHTK